MKRPNPNLEDACAKCGELLPTPVDLNAPGEGELYVYQPTPSDPPQWMCKKCWDAIESDPAATVRRAEISD